MGGITTGIGLISGIDTATLIDQLIALESRGKVNLQTRLAKLQQQQTALLDINARLLNLKNAARQLRTENVFGAATAISSDPGVLTATATGAARPGTYSFLVKQLASSSQKATGGFADSTSTPVGLTGLTFEIGAGFVTTDTELTELNGGQGAARGRIVITDSAGSSATVDLGAATTVGEVVDTINGAAGVAVTASVEGDQLVVTDTAGGAGTLTIADAPGYTTATDLGIAATDGGAGDADASADGRITGAPVRTLGPLTALSSLNDGTGVNIVDGAADLRITTHSGRTFDVDLGRIDNPITGATLIEDLNDGAGVTTNADSTEDIRFVDRDGEEHLVDLTGIATVQDLIDRVSDQTDGRIEITVTDGERFTVTDTAGGPEKLKVLGAGPEGTATAEDLGILETEGVDSDAFTGSVLASADHTPAASTIQDVIDRVNNARDDLGADNAGRVVASIAADGVSLRIEDTTAGDPNNFTISGTAGNPTAARDLGIEEAGGASVRDGDRLLAGLDSVLLRSLNGGAGLAGDTTLTIQDRSGASDTFVFNGADESLSDVINRINASGTIAVTASVNDAGNGLLITDGSGGAGNLTITGDAADDLGIDTGGAGVASTTVRGGDLELRYVAEGTPLAALNFGRGVGPGELRITDGEGDQVVIDIGSDARTVFDVISEINAVTSASNVDVTARVNDAGDGIALDNDLGSGLIRVDTVSGTTAADLRIEGQAGADGGSIDGSFEIAVELTASDTLAEIAQAVNDADLPVTASILDTGAGGKPLRLVFSADVGGRAGELLIDDGGFGLGLTTLSEARDAKVFFGAADPAAATLIQRSSNAFENVLPGLNLELTGTSDQPVTVSVNRDVGAIEERVAEFVAAFNDAVGRIDDADFFDPETEQRGILLGNPTTSAVRAALFRTVQREAEGIDTQFTFLSQVGITVGAGGVLEFDRDRFREATEADFEAVENLFTAFQGTTTTTEEIEPGVTVNRTQQTFSELGFADLFDQLLDGLTNSLDGTLTVASEGFDSRIDLTRDRIEAFDERLEARRAQLQREFAAMEAALARLQGQSTALLSLSSNLGTAQALLGL